MTDCDGAQARLGSYLRHALDPYEMAAIREHLDRCEGCWARWNRFRWDKAEGTPLYRELRRSWGIISSATSTHPGNSPVSEQSRSADQCL
ncbi:MAG: zf-HC2 domain-containing protein [Egibacteraceae bacterium]